MGHEWRKSLPGTRQREEVRRFSESEPELTEFHILCPVVTIGLVIATMCWKSIYLLLRYYNRVPGDESVHIVSMVHSAASTISCLIHCDLNRNALRRPPSNTWIETMILLSSMGYYIHTSFCFYKRRSHKFIIAHHGFSIFCLGFSILKAKYASLVAVFLWSYESPNLFLHLRFIMKKYDIDQKNARIFYFNEVCFLLCFVVLRFIIGLHFTYLVLINNGYVTFVMKLMTVIINLFNFFFCQSVYGKFRAIRLVSTESAMNYLIFLGKYELTGTSSDETIKFERKTFFYVNINRTYAVIRLRFTALSKPVHI